MTAQTIQLSEIDASDRKRPIDPATVAAYAAIAEERLAEGLSPIIEAFTVRPVEGGYKLVTGGHRTAMLHEIGFETLNVGVEVNIKEMTEAEAIQSELFENLANAGLKQIDRALFLYEAWKIAKEKRGETRGRKSKVEKLQEDKKSPEFGLFSSPRWSDDVARRLDMSRAAVFEAVRIAQALIETDAVEEIRGTMLEDNQNELKQLVEIPAEKRREAAAAIKRGEAKTVRDARVAIQLDEKKTDDPQARFYASAIDMWGKLADIGRANFLDAIGVPKDVAKKVVGNKPTQKSEAA